MDNDTVITNISKLGSMSTAVGCEAMRQLETESSRGKDVYAHLDKLFKLLDDRNPYARTRAFVLIAKNVSWDSRKKIDRNIDRLLKTVDGEQAATVRQCIQTLLLIAAAKPVLRQRIADALRAINPDKYPVRMRSILAEDIKIALAAAENKTE